MSLSWWTRVLAPDGEIRPGSGGPGSETYVALPGPRSPSILVDVEAPAAVARALNRSGAGTSRREALLRSLAARAVAVDGVRRRLPNRVHVVAGSGPTLRDELAERVGHDVVLWAAAGPVRPNRKPVVRVLDPAGRIVAFAKVGWDGATADLISNEVSALTELRHKPARGLIVPDVIDHFVWAGLSVLMTRPLPIDDDFNTDAAPDPETGALDSVIAYGRSESLPLRESAYWRALTARLGPYAELTAGQDESAIIDVGGHHGDWSPWNIRRTVSDIGVYAWDWERSRTDGPVGLDVAHYVMHVGRFIDGQTVAAAARRAQDALRDHLPRLDVDPARAELLVRVELLETLARIVESGLADQLTEHRDTVIDTLRPLAAGGPERPERSGVEA